MVSFFIQVHFKGSMMDVHVTVNTPPGGLNVLAYWGMSSKMSILSGLFETNL